MTFDNAIDILSGNDHADALAALQWLIDGWAQMAAPCRSLLHRYVGGADIAERTERALFYVVHALGEKADTAAFSDLCRLAADAERAELVFGDDTIASTVPRILISTFDGDPTPLLRVVEAAAADDMVRGDALMALAFLTRQRRLSDAWMIGTLSELPARLTAPTPSAVWFGWVRAVAALGYAGLAGAAEDLIRRGLVESDLMTKEDFWHGLRESLADPASFDNWLWDGIGPLGSAVAELSFDPDDTDDPEPLKPVMNPLRSIGRNDPCPCGSGRKFKKCCLDKSAALPAPV